MTFNARNFIDSGSISILQCGFVLKISARTTGEQELQQAASIWRAKPESLRVHKSDDLSRAKSSPPPDNKRWGWTQNNIDDLDNLYVGLLVVI